MEAGVEGIEVVVEVSVGTPPNSMSSVAKLCAPPIRLSNQVLIAGSAAKLLVKHLGEIRFTQHFTTFKLLPQFKQDSSVVRFHQT